MRIYKLLSFKLFVFISILLITLSSIVSYYQLNTHRSQYEKIVTECARRTSAIIIASTRHSMLQNHNELTAEIIATVSDLPGIVNIRIYDTQDSIVISTKSEEVFKSPKHINSACISCHAEDGKVTQQLSPEHQRRIYFDESGHRYLGFVSPIFNETSCSSAGCHAHRPDESVLGVLEVTMSMQETDAALDLEESNMITTSIGITLIIALSVGIFLWILVHVPLTKFLIGTKEISSGNLNYEFFSSSNDEIGELGKSFNKMTGDLRIAKREITEWSDVLEKRVKEKTEELQKTQERILQIEKMASLGKLSATVAHELNNPMAGILTYSKLIQRKLGKDPLPEEDKDKVMKQLKMIETESDRLGKIIKDLLLFSKKQEPDFKEVQLNDAIDMSFQLVAHHLELHNISLEQTLQPDLPVIQVDENQIKQMLLALYVNAVEAMGNEGVLSISTYLKQSEKKVYLVVRDNGKGIPKEVKPHIFEPFFTTKNAVKGFGLGLSVVYGIVLNHKAEISVESEINTGTAFIIKFPVRLNLKSGKI